MGVAQLTRVPNAWPSQNLTVMAGILKAQDGTNQLGSVPTGLFQGCEKFSFIVKVPTLSASNSLVIDLDSSIDGVNFTTDHSVGTLTITAVGNYKISYNGTPISVLKASYTQVSGGTATVAIDVEANPT